ncbi:RND family efflux transporter, MFP subunit [Saccharicrinis carchari]|uniref:RND family efflux transporter, MFP subunit n=1 Tax=Saccharicrinis carchari TaxID=1168039 RepID=A0A521AWJ8_SACCC|nr:efflux RND transporter periplasmic adaptor subunit [Saccharicrinis carchari]SMO39206.1 RND family efflux transporter, MFP subunit [Saccharicrinis carchari]
MKTYLIILCALLLTACGGKQETEEQIRPVFYQVVGKGSVNEVRSFAGISQASKQAKLSFRVGGNIEAIAVELGDSVKKGQVIARLDSTDYHINYSKAVMSQKNAQVQLIAARSAYQRIENLYVGNNASLSDYERAKAQYESAVAMASTADAQVRAAKNQLDYTILLAPYDGSITAIMAGENEMTGAGHPVVAFSSTNHMEVRTAVPENVIGQVKSGQGVTVSFGTLADRVFNGTVSEVGTGTGMASTYPVIVRLSEPTDQLLPGMTGTVHIPLDTQTNSKRTVIIPTDAVSHSDDKDFVYLARKDAASDGYMVARQDVITGELTPDGYGILEGLSTGDIVITAGLSALYEGRKVKLIDDNE